MNPIVKILMERDNISLEEATERLEAAQNRVWVEREDPCIVLEEDLGLEPDYVDDLI